MLLCPYFFDEKNKPSSGVISDLLNNSAAMVNACVKSCADTLRAKSGFDAASLTNLCSEFLKLINHMLSKNRPNCWLVILAARNLFKDFWWGTNQDFMIIR